MTGATGIAGPVFRPRDPRAPAAWYRTHLGVSGYAIWMQAAGPSDVVPFRAGTDYKGVDRRWMPDLRVDDLGALLARHDAAGIPRRTSSGWDAPEIGRFARGRGPGGKPVEPWEPAATPP